jgi:hypothetical protein
MFFADTITETLFSEELTELAAGTCLDVYEVTAKVGEVGEDTW